MHPELPGQSLCCKQTVSRDGAELRVDPTRTGADYTKRDGKTENGVCGLKKCIYTSRNVRLVFLFVEVFGFTSTPFGNSFT